jgi:hypothetical protein
MVKDVEQVALKSFQLLVVEENHAVRKSTFDTFLKAVYDVVLD